MTDFADDLAAIERIDAVPRMLEVVCRSTGLGFAAVARVTEDRWIACAVRDEIAFGLPPGGELRVETTICNEIRQHRRTVVIDDVTSDEVYCGHPTAARYGFRSYISVPIVLHDGTFFGTLCAIDPKPARLNTTATLGMFTLFAELIAFHLAARTRVNELERRVAERTVELADANRELQHRVVVGDADRQALRALTGQLERAREDERTRIARELHDDLGQALTGLKLEIQHARTVVAAPWAYDRGRAEGVIESMAALVETTFDSVERIVSELRPAILDGLGVGAAMEWLVGEVARRTGLGASCECDDDAGITPEVATALFRILQEALTNVSRHAGATTIQVTLHREGGDAVLSVTDDGRGLPDIAAVQPTSFGLLGMRERMRALDGTLSIGAAPGGGTRLVARCGAGGAA